MDVVDTYLRKIQKISIMFLMFHMIEERKYYLIILNFFLESLLGGTMDSDRGVPFA